MNALTRGKRNNLRIFTLVSYITVAYEANINRQGNINTQHSTAVIKEFFEAIDKFVENFVTN